MYWQKIFKDKKKIDKLNPKCTIFANTNWKPDDHRKFIGQSFNSVHCSIYRPEKMPFNSFEIHSSSPFINEDFELNKWLMVLFIFYRSFLDPLLFGHDHLWHSALPSGGLCWPIPGCRWDECGGPALSHSQGRGLLCSHDGLSGKRLLHHHCRLDLVLHPKHPLQHHRWPSLVQLRKRM